MAPSRPALRSLILACASAFACLAWPAATAADIAVGTALQGRLEAAQSRRWRVQVPAAHVVQGDFSGPGAVLDLLDAQGRHLRRLADAGHSPQGFTWQAQAGQQLQLRAGSQGTPYTLQLHRILAPATGPAAQAPRPESQRLQALAQSLADGGNTEAFWQERERQGTPLVEPLSERESLVTFLWRGSPQTRNVRLFGSPSGEHDPLQRLGVSDVWWVSFRMPSSARLSYRLAPDVPRIEGTPQEQRRMILATAQRDPLNPRVFPAQADAGLDAFQGYSVLELPQAPRQPWIDERPGVPAGRLTQHLLPSRILGNERAVWLYRPAHAEPQALLVLFDAHAYR